MSRLNVAYTEQHTEIPICPFLWPAEYTIQCNTILEYAHYTI